MKYIFLLMSVLNVLFADAQDFEVVIEQVGSEMATGIVYDNGDVFVFGGSHSFAPETQNYSPYFFKVSESGDIIWDGIIELEDEEVLPAVIGVLNDDYIVGGNVRWIDHIYLEKINGNTGWGSWAEIYDDFYGTIRGITSDENYIYITGAVFEADDIGATTYDFLVAKVSSNGDIIWRTSFGESETFEVGVQIVEYDNDNIIGTGSKRNIETNLIEVTCFLVSKDGDLIWDKVLDSNRGLLPRDIIISDNGYVYIAGDTQGYPGDVFLAKFNLNGDLIWFNIYNNDDDSQDLECSRLSYFNDRIFILATREVNSEFQTDIVLFAIDETGNLLCEEILVESDNLVRSVAEDIHINEGGETFILGSIQNLTANDYGHLILVQKNETPNCLINDVVEKPKESNIELYTSGSSELIINSSRIIESRIIAYDIMGRAVLEIPFKILPGTNSLNLPLNRGIYILVIEENGLIVSSEKIVKLE